MVTTMRMRWYLAFVVVFLVGVIFLWPADTFSRRQRASRRIQDLVKRVSNAPTDRKSLDRLVSLAKGTYAFEATIATSGLGRTKNVRALVVPELLILLEHEDPFIQREAALGLARQGLESPEEIELVMQKIEKSPCRRDYVWFCIDAIGGAGKNAVPMLPRLKLLPECRSSELCRGSLDRAIRSLESLEADQEAEPQKHAPD